MSKKKQRPGLGLRQEGLAQGYGKRGWRKWWTARARRRLARHVIEEQLFPEKARLRPPRIGQPS